MGMLEGLSFIALVFVAMPLKYFAGRPGAVSVVGLIHGILFLLFCLTLLTTMLDQRWSIKKALGPFIASLLPFGPFVIDRKLRNEDLALRQDNS